MSDGRHLDPRLLQALALLRDYVQGAWPGGADPRVPSDDWLESSTDVLTPWYPDAAEHGAWPGWAPPPAGAWDAYFAAFTRSFRADRDSATPLAEAAAAPRIPPATAGAASPPAILVEMPPQAEEPDEATAETVVDTLYDFLHALGRADVAAAMSYVADDYHAMEGDREVTREALRHQLEAVVDARRDRGLQVSLARVPEPIGHPLGVLVKLTVQIDSRAADGSAESLLLHRVAVFSRAPEERWLIASLGGADLAP